MAREIIDFHCHLGTEQAATYEERGERAMIEYGRNTRGLIEYMDKYGINRAVVFAMPMLPHRQREANLEILELVAREDRLIPFAFMDPRLPESPQLLEELVTKGCRGVKLHPVCHGYVVSHQMCYPTYEVAEEKGLPVLIHTGWGEYGEIRFIEKMARDFPNLQIVIGHLIEQKDIFSLAIDWENVSVETSYATHPRRIAQAVNKMGVERVIFGSDMPLSHPGFELLKIQMAPISDEDREKILGMNAVRLLTKKISGPL